MKNLFKYLARIAAIGLFVFVLLAVIDAKADDICNSPNELKDPQHGVANPCTGNDCSSNCYNTANSIECCSVYGYVGKKGG